MPPEQRVGAKLGGHIGRVLLVLLTLYGLALIVPDFYRLGRPLGSFGLTVDNDGLIFDVQGPFATEADLPAWQAGLRAGDRLDLQRMRCIPIDISHCASILAVRGGQQLVVPGATAALALAETSGRPADVVTVIARQRPTNWLRDLITFLDQIAGVLVVLGAAWLVWIRPGPMTWGFFIYAIQFNPAQDFEFYARLQQRPAALLAQQVADSILQAAGYAGLILFALRAPNDSTEPAWRPLERALPALATGLCALTLLSLGSAFGYPTEALTRAGLAVGFLVSAFVVVILLARRKTLSPQDYQRMRWIIWGCLIGLPACIIAAIAQGTSLLTLPDDAIGLLYLVNGVLCLFVVEAIRRRRVTNVAIPLRRGTILGLLLSAPAVLAHEQVNGLYENIELPSWAWITAASLAVFLISRLHEHAVTLVEGLFDLGLRRCEERFADIEKAVLHAKNAAEIDQILTEAPLRALKLASSALFRNDGGQFRRTGEGLGWTPAMATTIDGKSPLLAGKINGPPFDIDEDALNGLSFPAGPQQPIIAAPIGNPLRCYAIALYGPHATGADLPAGERGLIGKLAQTAAVAYAQHEADALRDRIAALERGQPLNSTAASGLA